MSASYKTSAASHRERAFERFVELRFRLYSGLFLGLPFPDLVKSGQLLPMFAAHCARSLADAANPEDIVTSFFRDNRAVADVAPDDALFLFLQLIERQVVLFDALEAAAFAETHAQNEPGSVEHLVLEIRREHRQEDFERVMQQAATRIVLTAHPTRFYPPAIEGILGDLRSALADDHLDEIERLLLQLGKTRFTNQARPTPLQEAEYLLSTLERVFYPVMTDIGLDLAVATFGRAHWLERLAARPFLQLGFWPGGDRDGHPGVTSETTRAVASMLKERVLQCHLASVKQLRRRLTFDGVRELLADLESRLHQTLLAMAGATRQSGPPAFEGANALLASLRVIRAKLMSDHQGLFVEDLDRFVMAVVLFGFHFASLDIRQSSDVFAAAVDDCADLHNELTPLARATLPALSRDTLETFALIGEVQASNGEAGCNRVIVSHAEKASDCTNVLRLLSLAGAPVDKIDIVPLFESIPDLQNAQSTFEHLLQSPIYREHLRARGDRQTVMVGFSDGTKDGGYLTANWMIRLAKRSLTTLGRSAGVRFVFFDGRGGPPARGGGTTHLYYRSFDRGIEQIETQLTIQGQTIMSNFGHHDAARFHIEHLCTANLENLVFPPEGTDPPAPFVDLLGELSDCAFDAYRALRDDPLFLDFLRDKSPLSLFSLLTIGSRPVKRSQSTTLSLSDLRAIPFVASWSVLKLQIPGFYGLGTALEAQKRKGRLGELQALYHESRFFRTLLDNAAMSLLKSRTDVTSYMQRDPTFGAIWTKIRDELDRTVDMVLAVSGQSRLLEKDAHTRRSIALREQMMLPLTVIIGYVMVRLTKTEGAERAALEKMGTKALAAIINATRNAA